MQKKSLIIISLVAFAAVGASVMVKTTAHKIKPLVLSNLNTEQKYSKPGGIGQETVKRGRVVTVPILMYHHVGPLPAKADSITADLTVTPKNFEEQVKWLKQEKFQTITLENLYLANLGKFKLPPKPLIFTFDDGYEDVFNQAVPILKKYGFIGSFAIITQWPGATDGANRYATLDEIKQAQSLGMEIVSHTQNHFDGTNKKYSGAYILKNLSDSRKDIKNNFGIATNILIYPYGHYDEVYVKIAKQAGFVMGLTTHFGAKINLDDLMHVPRLRVHGREDLETFKKVVRKNI